MIRSRRIDPVFIRYHFPELGADLVAALAGLHVDYFPHRDCNEAGVTRVHSCSYAGTGSVLAPLAYIPSL